MGCVENHKSLASSAVGWKWSFYKTRCDESLQNCPQGNFPTGSRCFHQAQGLLVLAGWSRCSPGKEKVSGANVMPPETFRVPGGVLEVLGQNHPPTTVGPNEHPVAGGRAGSASWQGQTFLRHPIIISPRAVLANC